ncbi:MAG: hypothetical protein EA409_01135 [Saprospirales bacterium]|nr:MAG: hypothetical protein EA409_01135 [Saprospirales bacterium]
MEGIWWIFSIVLVYAIMHPIIHAIEEYPFTTLNISLILLFFHYSRHVILLNYNILKVSFWWKVALALITPAILFYMAGRFGYFQTFMDEHSMSELMPELSYQRQIDLNKYIKNQMIFFSSGTIIAGILFVLRMVLSLWRQTNEKGV